MVMYETNSPKWKVIKFTVLLIIGVVCLVLAVLFTDSTNIIGKALVLLCSAVLGAFLMPIWDSFVDFFDTEQWKASQRKLERAHILKDNTMIRISFAYLYRIKVDNKFFLVKSKKTKLYQPVGGAYKCNEEEREYLTNNFFVEDDVKGTPSDSRKNDYRMCVPNKYLRKFVKRFNTTNGREQYNSLTREFKEELFDTGILSQDDFEFLEYTFVGRNMSDVHYSEVCGHYELLIADILDVKLSEKQVQIFRNLNGNDDWCLLANNDLILKHGIDVDNPYKETIANHSQKILPRNAMNLIRIEKEDKNKHRISFASSLSA